MAGAKLVKLDARTVRVLDRAEFEARIGGARQVVMIVASPTLGAVNRLHGFAAGDRALAEFETALRRAAPKDAALCHVGGAKYAMAAPAADDGAALEAMGGLFDDLARMAPDLGPPHVGGAWSAAAPGAEAMLSAAMSALDAARDGGPHGVELTLIDPAANATDMSLAREALGAIRAGAVSAAFQPVVDAETPGRILFREALIRLQRPSGEVVAAGRFMPTLTRLGLAAEADAAMLSLALDALAEDPALRLSVNLSAQSFGRPQWRERFLTETLNRPEAAERLIVEVTEDVATSDLASVGDLLALLRASGAALALDDFGAGRTSFSHLRDVRFDMVKIDGGFIRGIDQTPDNQVLVSALTSIARSFDMMIVAEFVETAQEARTLRKLGVDAFQGYLFGGPTLVWSDGRRVEQALA